jgi:hypothetical protein
MADPTAALLIVDIDANEGLRERAINLTQIAFVNIPVVVTSLEPFVSLYLPAAHAIHGPPSGPVYPILHGQSLVPGTESEFAGHTGQADEFRQFLNLPASHATHGPPSGPVNPAEQKQMLSPGIETELCGHAEHVLFDTACTSVENMFTGQAVHGTLAASLLYEPAAHDLQSLRPPPPKPALHRQLVTFPEAMCWCNAAMSPSVNNVCMK